jgi:hypothetical protein
LRALRLLKMLDQKINERRRARLPPAAGKEQSQVLPRSIKLRRPLACHPITTIVNFEY